MRLRISDSWLITALYSALQSVNLLAKVSEPGHQEGIHTDSSHSLPLWGERQRETEETRTGCETGPRHTPHSKDGADVPIPRILPLKKTQFLP